MLGHASTSSYARDPQTLRKLPVHDVLLQALLALDIERQCIAWRTSHGNRGRGCGRAAGTQLFMDDRQGGMRESRDGLDPVDNRVDRGRVFHASC